MSGTAPLATAAPRRPTSKLVPVVVSAGLALGVFWGLLFGIGKKTDGNVLPPTADLAPVIDARGEAIVTPIVVIDARLPDAAVADANLRDGGAASDGGAVLDGGVVVDGASAAPDAAAAKPVATTTQATVTFELTPANAELTVDGQVTTGSKSVTVVDGSTTIRVQARLSGYKSYDKRIKISADQTVSIRLSKRSRSSGSSSSGLMEP